MLYKKSAGNPRKKKTSINKGEKKGSVEHSSLRRDHHLQQNIQADSFVQDQDMVGTFGGVNPKTLGSG